jgi:hypothetical protein
VTDITSSLLDDDTSCAHRVMRARRTDPEAPRDEGDRSRAWRGAKIS